MSLICFIFRFFQLSASLTVQSLPQTCKTAQTTPHHGARELSKYLQQVPNLYLDTQVIKITIIIQVNSKENL